MVVQEKYKDQKFQSLKGWTLFLSSVNNLEIRSFISDAPVEGRNAP